MLIAIPIVVYLILMLCLAFYVNKKRWDTNGFAEEYYIGSRDMGGVVLAMTLIATYIGASSFIGGPGIAYKLGLGWVLLACIQVPTAFFTLGILGKKLAILSRKLNAVTLLDILRARYHSDAVVILSACMLLIFFTGSVVAQFIGGARLFESVTGAPYSVGLFLFALVVITYTTLGGFRAVVLTDAIQSFVMLLATFILFFVILKKGNGMESIMRTIAERNPNLLRPDSGGNIAKPFILSFWVLVGIGILGLPATTVRCMGFKNTKAMHRAMVIGTSVVGILMLSMHLIGVMGAAIEPNVEIGDKIIPILALKHLHPLLAGVFIAGPLAAIMSTIDSLLIISSSTIMKDLYLHYIEKDVAEEQIKKLSMYCSLGFGVLVFLVAMRPPKLLVWINLFSLAGQETLFFAPLLLGLYWKKANAMGAISSMLAGSSSYLYFTLMKTPLAGMHAVVPALAIALITFYLGTQFGGKPSQETLEIFFEG